MDFDTLYQNFISFFSYFRKTFLCKNHDILLQMYNENDQEQDNEVENIIL